MRSALQWAQVKGLLADGLSQREVARRLEVNRRTVARLAASAEPPCYRRSLAGSQLDPLEPALRQLLEEWPQIKAPRVLERLEPRSRYLSKEKLADLLGVAPRTIKTWRERGLPGRKVGREVMFNVEEVERWIDGEGSS